MFRVMTEERGNLTTNYKYNIKITQVDCTGPPGNNDRSGVVRGNFKIILIALIALQSQIGVLFEQLIVRLIGLHIVRTNFFLVKYQLF
jgi:hypothetical protein